MPELFDVIKNAPDATIDDTDTSLVAGAATVEKSTFAQIKAWLATVFPLSSTLTTNGDLLTRSGGVPARISRADLAADAAFAATYLTYAKHGMNADFTRPVTDSPVVWLGPVEPANLAAFDVWIATSYDPSMSLLDDLEVWYDAADAATITHVAGAVTAWTDKSNNGFDLAASTTGARPATGTTTINGRNVVRFDGSSDWLLSDGINIGAERTTYAVISAAAHNATRRVIVQAGNSVLSYPQLNMEITDTDKLVSIGQDALRAEAADVMPDVQPIVVSRTLTGDFGTLAVYQNGVQQASVAMVSETIATGTTIAVGGRYPGDRFFYGDIAEILDFSTYHDATMRARVHNYLSRKWGIALP